LVADAGGIVVTLKAIVAGNPLVDALLRVAGLPAVDDVEAMLEKMGPVEVKVDCSGSREPDCKLVRLLLKGYERVRLVEDTVPRPRLGHEVPSPSISVGGRLGWRFRFHGVSEELLAPPFMLAVAAAGGAWPSRLNRCPPRCGGGSLALYVVPGLPCVKAVVLAVELLLCCQEASVDVINIDTLAAMGASLPVDRVPAFRADGRVRVGLPKRGVEELVELLKEG
jgi:hypothetical protein